jgi:hypothetical protein
MLIMKPLAVNKIPAITTQNLLIGWYCTNNSKEISSNVTAIHAKYK